MHINLVHLEILAKKEKKKRKDKNQKAKKEVALHVTNSTM